MPARNLVAVNVAEAKRQFSDLLGRVSYGGATILITRRGKPMARLVPANGTEPTHLATVKGWLEPDDRLFSVLEDITTERQEHIPRVLERTTKRKPKRR